MKKIIIAVISLFAVAAVASAQPRAIGGRLGSSLEASYQHNVGGENFFEIDLGLVNFLSFNGTVSYNFMIAQPDWTPKGEWGFYAGPGVSMGASFLGAFNVGLAANVGLEYTFWFPLQLAVDLRPTIGVNVNRAGAYYYWEGLYGFIPTFAVRYCF